MRDEEATLDRFLARWVLERATPEEAVRLATRALEDGCDGVAVAVIAGSNATTRADIDAELPALLRAWNKQLPSADAALKLLVDDCARQIVSGQVDPVRGAWAIWDFWVNEGESPRFFDQVRLFIGLASECDNAGPHIAGYRADIVEEANAFLARGGLQLPL
jgi:hypothetical protein